MPPQPIKRAKAREYRDKYGMDMPTKKLARIMQEENELLFKHIEDARSHLRDIEGKSGKKKNDEAPNAVGKSKYFMADPRPKNPYSFPESDEQSFDPYILNGHKVVGIACDLHAPYHSVEALTLCIDYFKQMGVDAILINGDMWDFHGISRFVRDPSKKNFGQELNIGCDIIKKMQDATGAVVYLKFGNHDERYQHYLWTRAAEISDVEDFKLENLIKNRIGEIPIIKDKRIIKLNSLNVLHGHEFGQSVFSPVNIARGLFLKGNVTAIQGHNHRTSEHVETDMNGKILTCWSIAALCGLHPEFLPINKWNQGCAAAELNDNQEDFEVQNKRFYRGKIL
jgi:hypothetical protein